METRIAEIADGIYRLSTFVPDIAPPAGFTFNQFLVLGRRAAAVPHRAAAHVPAGPRRRGPDHPARAAALDRLRPLRGRRVRRHERVARRRTAGAGGARADRLPGLAQRHGRSRAARAGRRRGDRARRRQAACATSTRRTSRTAGTPACCYEETTRHPALRRPVHPARQRPGADRGRHGRARRSRPRTCSATPASAPAWARRSAASPSSRRARWP